MHAIVMLNRGCDTPDMSSKLAWIAHSRSCKVPAKFLWRFFSCRHVFDGPRAFLYLIGLFSSPCAVFPFFRRRLCALYWHGVGVDVPCVSAGQGPPSRVSWLPTLRQS